MDKKPSVFIVDDHHLLAEGLTELVNGAGMQVSGIASDGITATQQVLALKPDLILMDLDMPGLNGIEASRKILEEWPEARIIIISMHLERALIDKCRRIGARGYLPKNTHGPEFIIALGKVLKGKTFFWGENDGLPHKQALKSPLENSESTLLKINSLSSREEEIIKLIADGLNSREIAEKLYLSPHTVETHRKNIMRKLEINNTAGLIRFAIKAGLIG